MLTLILGCPGDGLLDPSGGCRYHRAERGQVAGLNPISPRRSKEGQPSRRDTRRGCCRCRAAGEVDAQVSNLLALSGVSELAVGGHAVLGAADAADLGLDGHALGVGKLNELLGAVEVKLEGLS